MFEDGDVLYVNEVAVCELASGIRPTEEGPMMALLEPLEFIKPAEEAALTAAQWRQAARAGGSFLGVPDALIAAAAHANDATVLTRNVRDFALTPAKVETY